jgi:hypothetical protein
MKSMKIGTFILMYFFAMSAYGQKELPQNYKRFDQRFIHFGFMLGWNSASFSTYQTVNAFNQYKLKSLVTNSQPGGQVGIVTTMKLGTPVVRLRFIPTLSFQERALNYTYLDTVTGKDFFKEERVNSTNIDFPLMFQFRTMRLNNFASYVLLGGQPSIDLQSQEKASQNYADPFIKIKKFDFQGQIGGGVEFFTPYFKFGIELKYSQGFTNSFIQDNTESSRPIDRLYNRVWWVSFIFEG